jgi:hypothetical protein
LVVGVVQAVLSKSIRGTWEASKLGKTDGEFFPKTLNCHLIINNALFSFEILSSSVQTIMFNAAMEPEQAIKMEMNESNMLKFRNYTTTNGGIAPVSKEDERVPRPRDSITMPNLIAEYGPTLENAGDMDYEPRRKKPRVNTPSQQSTPRKYPTHGIASIQPAVVNTTASSVTFKATSM